MLAIGIYWLFSTFVCWIAISNHTDSWLGMVLYLIISTFIGFWFVPLFLGVMMGEWIKNNA